MLVEAPSRWLRGWRSANVKPTPSGTATASAIHTTRTVHAGIHAGSGMKPRTKVAALGTAVPSSKRGHAAAAPTTIERAVFSLALVCPNSATTAQPNAEDAMRPSERLIRLRTACRTAMEVANEQEGCQYSRAPRSGHQYARKRAHHRHRCDNNPQSNQPALKA